MTDPRAEALKIIQLRDRVLAKETPVIKRLKIEKKIRAEYKRTSHYKKLIRSGRLDQIDKESRDSLFMPYDQLEKAYYETYRARKDRDEDGVKAKKQVELNPTDSLFYDDEAPEKPTTSIEKAPAQPNTHQKLPINQPQISQTIPPPPSYSSTPVFTSTLPPQPSMNHRPPPAPLQSNMMFTPFYTFPIPTPIQQNVPPYPQQPQPFSQFQQPNEASMQYYQNMFQQFQQFQQLQETQARQNGENSTQGQNSGNLRS